MRSLINSFISIAKRCEKNANWKNNNVINLQRRSAPAGGMQLCVWVPRWGCVGGGVK